MRVPMLIMSTRCFRSKSVAMRPDRSPDKTVATSGVCVEECTRDRNRGIRPSEAIAYSTLCRKRDGHNPGRGGNSIDFFAGM